MKFKFFCMLGLLGLLSSCNDKKDTDVVSQRFVHKYGFDVSESEWSSRNKEGQVITTLKNGVTQSITYKNGIYHGPFTLTFPFSTVLQEKSEYNEGTLVKKTVYELSGLPIQETVFETDGKKIITVWDMSGVPLSMEEYSGQLLMSARYYNSQNEIEATIIDGNGTRIKRDRTSLLLSKEKVENGQIVKRTTFHPNGVVQSHCSFIDYKQNGLMETFSPSGKLLSRSHWKNGELNGVQSFYKDDKILSEIHYLSGKKHGLEKEYDNKGYVVKEINWANDKRHGTSRYTVNDVSDMQWFWKGNVVERKKYQMLKFREELIAEIRGEKIENNDRQSVDILDNKQVAQIEENLSDEINNKIDEETPEGSKAKTLGDSFSSSNNEESVKSINEIKAEIKALKAQAEQNKAHLVSKKNLKKENVKNIKENKQIALNKEKAAPKKIEKPKVSISQKLKQPLKAVEKAPLKKAESPKINVAQRKSEEPSVKNTIDSTSEKALLKTEQPKADLIKADQVKVETSSASTEIKAEKINSEELKSEPIKSVVESKVETAVMPAVISNASEKQADQIKETPKEEIAPKAAEESKETTNSSTVSPVEESSVPQEFVEIVKKEESVDQEKEVK